MPPTVRHSDDAERMWADLAAIIRHGRDLRRPDMRGHTGQAMRLLALSVHGGTTAREYLTYRTGDAPGTQELRSALVRLIVQAFICLQDYTDDIREDFEIRVREILAEFELPE